MTNEVIHIRSNVPVVVHYEHTDNHSSMACVKHEGEVPVAA